ncbi:MAG: hypothetical protein WCC08_05825 [Terrimicrobiaceae bacterium]
MKPYVVLWSLILLCFSMAAAIGGGLYEHFVLTPIWQKSSRVPECVKNRVKLIVQHPALLIAPIARETLARIPEVIGPLYPHLFALQRPLKLFEHEQFVVVAIDLRFAVDLLEHHLFPTGRHNAFDWHSF